MARTCERREFCRGLLESWVYKNLQVVFRAGLSKSKQMLPFDVFRLVVRCTTTSPRHSPALAPRLRYRLLPEACEANLYIPLHLIYCFSISIAHNTKVKVTYRFLISFRIFISSSRPPQQHPRDATCSERPNHTIAIDRNPPLLVDSL